MADETCHVGNKHAGLLRTDCRNALQVKNESEFDHKLCVTDLHLKQMFDVSGKMLRTSNKDVSFSDSDATDLRSRKPAGFCIFKCLRKKKILLSESDIFVLQHVKSTWYRLLFLVVCLAQCAAC